ncbi:helix-turn-helix transcriptional regulator [Streptomyces capparidis]
MPLRSTSTARQQRLGIELRKLRERAGLSSTEAARRLGTSPTQISNIEASRLGVSAERLRAMAYVYSCSDQALIDALAAMTGERKHGWWEQYRNILPAQLLEFAELEYHATELQTATVLHIPGLLQTVDYARALFREVMTPLSPPEVEHRLSFRIKRQEVLYQEDPLPFTAIVHEAALRMRFGSEETTREQLQHLIDMGERDNITVLVIPFSGRGFPGTGQSIDHLYGPVPQLDTVVVENHHGSDFVSAEAQLEKYRYVLGRMEATALKPAESRDLIHQIKQSM